MTESFCKITRPLIASTHWVSLTTSEQIAFGGYDKILWVWMKDRYDFFTSQGNAWFDNQDAIAEYTGCSLSTIKRFIQALTKHGYLRKVKRRVSGCASSNSYTIVQDLILVPTPAKKSVPAPPLPVMQVERVPAYAPIVFPAAITAPATTLAKIPVPARIDPVLSDDDDFEWVIYSSS